MEGIFFYWFSWIGWIIVTFLWKKSLTRTFLSHFLLLLIIFANISVSIFSHQVNLSFIFLFLLCFYLLKEVHFQKLCYFLIISLCTVAFSTGLRLFLIYDPVIAIFHSTWMLAIVNFIFIQWIVKEKRFRIPLFMMGICQSEIIYSLFLANIYGTQTIGDLFFLDLIAITISFLYVWNSFEKFSSYLSFLVKKRVQSVSK